MDRLGQTYLALDRPADAAGILRKAAVLSPDDSKIQLHLARALADIGAAAESKVAMDRFRQLGPVVAKSVPGGLVDYLSLTPEQRRADYRARVERMVREHPQDAAGQLTYIRLLLEDGKPAQAVDTARKLFALKPAPALLAEAGRALLQAREYAAARDLLQQIPAASAAEVQLDLAIAAFHASGAGDGIALLDRIPESARNADFYLAQFEMTESLGKTQEAAAALQQALTASPTTPGLYLQASAFLLGRGRTADALRVSDEGLTALPQSRQILLLKAITLDRAGSVEEAQQVLELVESRWPEWPQAWLAAGVILSSRGRPEGLRSLDTAIALGAGTPEVRGYRDALSAGTAARPPDLLQILVSYP
jgi:predicted Zn-dependent protease